MKRAIVVFLLLLSCRFIAAQDLSKEEFSSVGEEAVQWYKKGMVFQMHQQYEQALDCMEKARQGFHETGNKEYEFDALFQIGDIKSKLGNQENGALEAYRQVDRWATERSFVSKLMPVLIREKRLLDRMGEVKQAQYISMRMDSLASTIDDGSILFDYHNYLGDDAMQKKNYGLAGFWYEKNGPYINGLPGNHSLRTIYYMKLYYLNISAGEYDRALDYAYLKWNVSQEDKDPVDIFFFYQNVSEIYKRKGDKENCYKTLDTLFNLIGQFHEPKEVSMLYFERARTYMYFQDYGKAMADFRAADSVLATRYDETDEDRMGLLVWMGHAEYYLGHYDEEMVRLYRKYQEGIRNLKGENSRDNIDALIFLANAEGFAGQIQEGCRDYKDAFVILRQHVQKRMPYFTTAEREGYWKSVSELVHLMTPFALEAKEFQSSFSQACYDGLILEKGFLLASERSVRELVESEGTDDDKRDYALVSDMQNQIKEWEKNEKEHVDSILYLTSRITRLENQLASRCRGFGDMTKFMDWDYQSVKEKINEGDVLIDFTDFVKLNGERIYAAYVVNSRQKYPLLKKLFSESEIDSLEVKYPDMFYEDPVAEEMVRLLWEPFQEHVEEGATVYYVPSQLLYRIAIESLPLEDGTLLGDHYRFVRLSSARELACQNENRHIDMALGETMAVLYGGLNYGKASYERIGQQNGITEPTLLSSRDEMAQHEYAFRELPWTMEEIETIRKVLEAHQMTVDSYCGAEGTEESFLGLSGKAPQILHVATHGFYYSPDEAQEINYLRGYKDAMSLSGLVMSGGNEALRGQEVQEGLADGILRASQIARLDLSGVNLVVLSACHSGQGKATEEGLYGLQRAFKKAGAKTMIMSLWEVNDRLGAEYMSEFYENLMDVSNGFDKRKAFDKAKSYMKEKYPEPFYWAGFVMVD